LKTTFVLQKHILTYTLSRTSESWPWT